MVFVYSYKNLFIILAFVLLIGMAASLIYYNKTNSVYNAHYDGYVTITSVSNGGDGTPYYNFSHDGYTRFFCPHDKNLNIQQGDKVYIKFDYYKQEPDAAVKFSEVIKDGVRVY